MKQIKIAVTCCREYIWVRLRPKAHIKRMRCKHCCRWLRKEQVKELPGAITAEDIAASKERVSRYSIKHGNVTRFIDCPQCSSKVELRDSTENCFEGRCDPCNRGIAVVANTHATSVSVFSFERHITGRAEDTVPDPDLYFYPPGLLGEIQPLADEPITWGGKKRTKKEQRAVNYQKRKAKAKAVAG